MSLDIVSQADPVRGLKIAQWDGGRPGQFLPIYTAFHAYGLEGKAVCQRARMRPADQQRLRLSREAFIERGHPAPHPGCWCGFYAWQPGLAIRTLSILPGHVALDVELYGTVVEHEKGYRCEYQRVLRIGLFPGSHSMRPWFEEHYPTEVRVIDVPTTYGNVSPLRVGLALVAA